MHQRLLVPDTIVHDKEPSPSYSDTLIHFTYSLVACERTSLKTTTMTSHRSSPLSHHRRDRCHKIPQAPLVRIPPENVVRERARF